MLSPRIRENIYKYSFCEKTLKIGLSVFAHDLKTSTRSIHRPRASILPITKAMTNMLLKQTSNLMAHLTRLYSYSKSLLSREITFFSMFKKCRSIMKWLLLDNSPLFSYRNNYWVVDDTISLGIRCRNWYFIYLLQS